MSNNKSRWASAPREQLEALAEACAGGIFIKPTISKAMQTLEACCPPLRTKAEVAAEALDILRSAAQKGDTGLCCALIALAKEPTRD